MIEHEWDVEEWGEVVDGEPEILGHNFHGTAYHMIDMIARHPADNYHPVVVRTSQGNSCDISDRYWAYLVRGDSGCYYLPEFFVDGSDRRGPRVPAYLKRQLADAQR